MADKIFLYWGSGSPNAWKPMLALEEKGLSGYKNKQMDFGKGEHKSAEVTKINPRGQLPAFKDGDQIINESNAICLYLERKYPNKGTKLIPDDVTGYANVMQKVFEVASFQMAILVNIVGYKNQFKDKVDKEILKTRIESARGELKTWDGHLSAGGYLAGRNFSMADVIFYPMLAFSVRLGLDIRNYRNLKAYYDKVTERPAVKASWPPHWKAGPGDNKPLAEV